MEQVDNNLSLIYNLNNENQIVNMSFDINERKLNISCTCPKKCFCYHTDYMVDFIYDSYFHYDEVDYEDINTYQSNNKLWLPAQETDLFDNKIFINIELLYVCGKFHYYCSHCEPGIHTVENCSHLDYIIKKFTEHYYDLKEENEDINSISFDALNFNQNDSSMEIEN